MRRRRGFFTLLALLLGVLSMYFVLPREAPQPRFTDVTASSGIDFRHENGARGKRYMPETVVGGAAWLDYDRDGLFDLYLVTGNLHSDRGGPGDEQNRLYRNAGGGRFSDVTGETGTACQRYGSGAAVGDYDNDGFPDLYVTCFGPNVLLHDEAGKRFRDATDEAGVVAGGWSTSAAFLDCDLDGDLDLYVCRYVAYDPSHGCRQAGEPTYCSPREFAGVPDILFQNRGGGRFEDESARAGVAVAGPREGKSLGVVVFDGDDDGDPDILVACDQTPNLYFRNTGDGTFVEAGDVVSLAYGDDGRARAGMGVDAGDVDLDGRQDIVVTNFADEGASLFRAQGGGFFAEESRRFGVAGPTLRRLGFGVVFIDWDLDGDLDLYVGNGHVLDNIARFDPSLSFAQPDQLLENDGGKGFIDASARAGEWFQRATVTRSVATCDFDEDGDEDIAVLCAGEKAVLLRNDSPRSHWIAFALEGRRSNRDAYGAKVTVRARRGGEVFTRVLERRSARSYASACDPRVRVGLGREPVAVESVEVRWPSGIRQVVAGPEIDRVHRVVEMVEGGQ